MTSAVELLQGAGVGHWLLDPAASSVRISSRTAWGLATVRGTFATLAGEGRIHRDGSVTGTLTVQAASLSTRNPLRDRHLRSADFLDAAVHPRITFDLDGAEPSADRVDLTGRLTVRGRTQPLVGAAGIEEISETALTLRVETGVDYHAFGMRRYPFGMMPGPAMVTAVARFVRRNG